jgi:hypothetical protein
MKMHRATFAVLTTVVCLALYAQGRSHAEDDGFVSLFNGEDFSGWVIMGKKEGWTVTDGVIRSEGATGGKWLRSEKQYGNFVLKVEWRVSKGGNSGVFIRTAERGLPWFTGYEVQITNAPRDDAHCTGSLYGYVAVKPRPDESADKWHEFEIRCRDNHLTVIADGVTCVDHDQSLSDKTRNKPLKGYVGLQDSHSSTGHYIEYRNVKIKVLD